MMISSDVDDDFRRRHIDNAVSIPVVVGSNFFRALLELRVPFSCAASSISLSIRKGQLKQVMEKQNLDLYWRNIQIMQENDRLRKTAQRLRQENEALYTELKQRLAAKRINKIPELELTLGPSSAANQMKPKNPQPPSCS
ncbi:putative hippocampus abundant transcript-like protein 1-like [Capsicum annuum]|nr:putative hippocampus abundant transcript-like protein 1-like [Capsicum annuum]